MLIADRYECGEDIGEGGMGRVVRATDRNTGRQVAVKLMRRKLIADETAIRRFEREMQAMLLLEHPNIARLYDFGRTDSDELYLVMELIDGRSLADEIVEHGRFPIERAVRIGQHIARALAAVHAKGIVHRDLKPENIMLRDLQGEADWVTILDFGIATLEGSSRVTQTGMVAASPAYCSPEQAKGGLPGPAGDLYALGIVLYELIAGCLPYQSETQLGHLYAHVNSAPTPLEEHRPETPQWLLTLVGELLEKDPDDRPVDAASVLKRLQRAPPPAAAKPSTASRLVFPDTDMIKSGVPLEDRTTATPGSLRKARAWLVAIPLAAAATTVILIAVGTSTPDRGRSPTAELAAPDATALVGSFGSTGSHGLAVVDAGTLDARPSAAEDTAVAHTTARLQTDDPVVRPMDPSDVDAVVAVDAVPAPADALRDTSPVGPDSDATSAIDRSLVRVTSTPRGARVRWDGGDETTPFIMKCKAKSVVLSFTASNRLSQSRRVVCLAQTSVHVVLPEP